MEEQRYHYRMKHVHQLMNYSTKTNFQHLLNDYHLTYVHLLYLFLPLHPNFLLYYLSLLLRLLSQSNLWFLILLNQFLLMILGREWKLLLYQKYGILLHQRTFHCLLHLLALISSLKTSGQLFQLLQLSYLSLASLLILKI